MFQALCYHAVFQCKLKPLIKKWLQIIVFFLPFSLFISTILRNFAPVYSLLTMMPTEADGATGQDTTSWYISISFHNYFVFFFANSFFLRTFAPDQAKLIEKLTFMLDRTQTIEKLKTTRQYLDEHYGVHSMMLFGSLARNEQREDSDVDICVEMVPNLFNRAGVKIYLQELLGCDVDVVRMREKMNPLLKQQILKYGIRVY